MIISLLEVDEASCLELNAADLIPEKGEGKKITMSPVSGLGYSVAGIVRERGMVAQVLSCLECYSEDYQNERHFVVSISMVQIFLDGE